MPTARVETNLTKDFFPEKFMSKLITKLAELMSKDKSVMKYVFDTEKDMTIVSPFLYQPTQLAGACA